MLTTYIMPDASFHACMRQPRIELGAQRWQRWILPLNHWHLMSQSQLLPIYKHYLLHARLQPTYTNTIFVPQHTVRNNTKHLVEYLDYYLQCAGAQK